MVDGADKIFAAFITFFAIVAIGLLGWVFVSVLISAPVWTVVGLIMVGSMARVIYPRILKAMEKDMGL